MTKAEERRLFLQQQSQATPTQPVVQPTASAPTKAEQRRVQLAQQQIASPLRSALSMASGIQTIANNVPAQPTIAQPTPQPQPAATQPVQRSQTAAPVGSMQEKLQNGGTLNLQEQEQLARELGINNETIDYTRGRINAAKQINPATKYAYELFRSGIKENPNSDHLKNMFEENDPIRAYDRSIEAGKLRAVKPQAEAEAKAIFDEIKSPGTFGNEGYVGGQEYQEYKGKLEEAKANKDYYNIAKYQYLYDKAKEDLKKNMKSWYGASYEKDMLKIIDNIDMHKKAYDDAKGGKYEEFYREKLARDLRDLADAETYSELFRNKVIDEAEILLHTGSANLANTLEGIMRDTSGPLFGMPGDLRQIKGSDLIETNKKAQQPSDKIEFTMGRSSFDHLKAYIEKHPEASQELKDVYAQISNGTYKGTAKDIDRIVGEEFDKRNTLTARENLERKLQIQNEMFDEKYQPSDFEKKVEDALEVVVAQIPQRGLMLVNPGLGYTAMYENAGNQNYNRVRADGANLSQAQANKILSGGLEVGTELLTESSIDTAFGGAGLLNPRDYTKFITNGAIRTGLNTGFDFAGEGFEEMVSTEMQPWIDRITYNPNARLATEDELWGSFVDSLLPTAILGGTSRAMVAVENYANSATRKIQNSTLTDAQKAELINEIENGRKELIKQLESHKEEIDTAVEETQNNTPTETTQQETPQNDNILPTNEELTQNETNKIANEPIVNVENETKEKPTRKETLTDIANLTKEDAKQQPMNYKQKKDKNTSNQRRFFDNLETSNIISEETKNNLNPTTYEAKHNLDTLEKMRDKLEERGNSLVEEWKIKTKNFTDDDVALGSILIERYQQNGDFESAARTAEKLADMSTEIARALQMYSIWQRLSPETMQIFTQKQLNEAFEEMKKKKTGKWVEQNKDKFKLTAEEAQFIYDQVEKASQATDEETKQRELSKIENMINNKLPPQKGQAIRALRRIAMLLNPKTQVRNFTGNALIIPVNDVADIIGTAIDKAISLKTKTRTTSVPNPITKIKGFGKGIQQAVRDYRTGTRTTASGSKYEFDIGAKSFNENTPSKVRNAINRKLNGINDLLSAVMSGGDRPFYEAAYRNSLEGQMKANKVAEPTQDMIDIAVNEALQRTWNDNNEYTKAVLGIRRAMNKINIHGFGLGDLIIPFAKTPANLTKAMVEYSPVGFINSIIDANDMRKAISRNEMTPAQQKKFVSSTSKAITGTMLYLIIASLVKAGKIKITGSADDDKDVRNFEQNVMGIQPYSVKVGDKTYTYSWANPINAPLAVVADTYKMSQEDAEAWDILNNGFKVAGEVLVDNSFLQGIKELFSKDSIVEGVIDSVESFPESLIPTFMSQIASLNDDTKRQTYEYKDDLKSIENRIKNKIPGARNTLAPQVNTFGEEVENQNSLFDAFINPANVREARVTPSQQALYDIYLETKDKTIFPDQAPNYVTVDDEKVNLSSEDKVTYQKASGQYITEVYDGLFNQGAFNEAYHVGNEGKVEILKQIKEDANIKGREAVGVTTKNTKTLNEKLDKLDKAGIPLADYYLTWYAQKNQAKKQGKKTAVSNVVEYINEGDHQLDRDQKNVLYEIFNIN